METQTKTSAEGRKASPAQTVKSFGNNVKKLIELKLVNEKDGEDLKKLQNKIVKQYLGIELL